MAQLSPAQASIADQALQSVRDAAASARAALDAESGVVGTVLGWVSGAGYQTAQREEDLRHTEIILADLERRRPSLTVEQLPRYLDLASAGADVSGLVAASRQLTAAAFSEQVIAPTVAELDPTNLSGAAGKLALGAAVLLAAVLVLKRS